MRERLEAYVTLKDEVYVEGQGRKVTVRRKNRTHTQEDWRTTYARKSTGWRYRTVIRHR